MAKGRHFLVSMIADAQKASTAMQSSAYATQLAAMGFTPATMAQEASALTDLHQKAQAAHSAWLLASAALQAKAEQFGQVWSSYCNIVRGVTPDATARTAHGVSSPGTHKGPSFKRGPRATAAAAAPAGAATSTAAAATAPAVGATTKP